MAWGNLQKFRPLMPLSTEALNQISDNLQYLYDNIISKSFAVPEPSRLDNTGSGQNDVPDWDDNWKWDDVDNIGLEYVMLYSGERRYLWYRYPLNDDGSEKKDTPHITFAFDWGSSRSENHFSLPDDGGEQWLVQDLHEVDDLVPGMVLSVHSIRCAMLRDVSE
jgi:hypothetical protein